MPIQKSGCVAQSVEQLTLNQRVTGSIPVAPTKLFNSLVISPSERTAVVYIWFTDFVQSYSLISIRLNALKYSLFISDRNIDELEDCHAVHEQLYLDEIESRTRCKARGCKGRMRMAMDRQDEMSGFVGGLA